MIYLYYGPDDFSIREAVQRLLRAALPPEAADLNTTRLAADDVTLDALRFACEATPFLADRRAVIVERLFARLAARRPRDAKETRADPEPRLAAELARYLPAVPRNTLLVLVERDAPPKSGPLAEALALAQVKPQVFPILAGGSLARWIKERAKAAGVGVSNRAVDLLATYVAGDLSTLSNELGKLATYAGPGRTIDVEDVRLLVHQASEASMFDLVDGIGQGNRSRAVLSLHQLLEQGERPERILGMVARQVRLLLQAKDLVASGEAHGAVARALGLAPFPARKILDQVRLFELPWLEAMHRRVLDADVAVKTGQQEPALALDLLVVELASAARS